MNRHPLPKTCLLAVAWLLACVAGPADAGSPGWTPVADFVVDRTESSAEGAKVYEDGRPRLYLVDLPSEPTLFLIDLQAMTAFAIRREDVVTTKAGGLKTRNRFAWNVPVSRITDGFSFPLGDSEVRVVREQPKPPEDAATKPPEGAATPEPTVPEPANPEKDARRPVPPGSPAPPASPSEGTAHPQAAGPDARACVSLQTRPATGVPGCTRFVYVRNSCDAPVVALVQRTEHLMTGTLPQSFDTVVPPGEQWIGCAWWSGAMAPAKHELLGASYLHAPKKVAEGRPGAPPRR